VALEAKGVTAELEDAVLRVVPMSSALMRALAEGRMPAAERELGARICSEWSLPGDLLEMRIAQLEARPQRTGWLLCAVVLKAQGLLIGNVGFHGQPGEHVFDARWPNVVELGYDIVEGFRRRGYASRAIELLLGWARARGGSQVVLSIALDNLASQRTADKLGFALIEEYEHDARGRELLYGLRL
jgi:RimJ/RimL family protein N-acetyltransferase